MRYIFYIIYLFLYSEPKLWHQNGKTLESKFYVFVGMYIL